LACGNISRPQKLPGTFVIMKIKQLINTGPRKIELQEQLFQKLSDNSILVQNEYTAISVGTEVYNFIYGKEPNSKTKFPRTTGYCNAGIVIEVGKEINGIVPGDRVAGQGNHASHSILTGMIHKIPDTVSSKEAAFMVMCATSLHGHRVANPKLGESVVVTGMGIVGQLAASFARLSGALPIIAIDLDNFRLSRAKARGIDICINPEEVSDISSIISTNCITDGADLVIEATGISSIYQTALSLSRTGGRFLALGSPRNSVNFSFLEDVHLREVTILGAHQPKTPDESGIYYPWSKQRDRELILHLMKTKKLVIEDLITHEVNPFQCQSVYDMLADYPHEVLGTVFDWTE